MSTVTQERRGIDPAFVRAARWLRANGWTPRTTKMWHVTELEWASADRAVSVTGERLMVRTLTPYGNWADDVLTINRPDTVQQAINYLVVAGVLPVELASWAGAR